MSVRDKLLEFIDTLVIVDTHEHLPNEDEWAAGEHDVLTEYLIHYFPCDLVSAGLSPRDLEAARDSSRPLMARWDLVEPYWNAARNTAYARALDIAARDVHGAGPITRETIEPLNTAFLEARENARSGKSHYRRVLKDLSRIAVSITDRLGAREKPADEEFFRGVLRIEGLIDLASADALAALGESAGIRIHSLDDYVAAVTAVIDGWLARGIVGLKAPFAYSRPIHFAKRTRAAAEEAFNSLFGAPTGPEVGTPRRLDMTVLEDYMMHQVLRLADDRGLTVQVHTGLQEGNGNYVQHSNPELLVNLFLEYRNVTFDIFHMSYPYEHVLSALAKNNPNVVIDMCWAHLISPEASVRALSEFLDAVPANKISAFGGDFLFPDGVYGHQYLARHDVAKSLAMKVDEGTFDLDRAKEIAQWLFVDNPARVFSLNV